MYTERKSCAQRRTYLFLHTHWYRESLTLNGWQTITGWLAVNALSLFWSLLRSNPTVWSIIALVMFSKIPISMLVEFLIKPVCFVVHFSPICGISLARHEIPFGYWRQNTSSYAQRAWHRRTFFTCRAHVTDHQTHMRFAQDMSNIPCFVEHCSSHSASRHHFSVNFSLRHFRPSHQLWWAPHFLYPWAESEPNATPQGGILFGHLAEQSPLTGCEAKSLNEISSEHTPINFCFRVKSFDWFQQHRDHGGCV